MGSQTSTSRHQALSDAHQSGIPGIGFVHRYDINGCLLSPSVSIGGGAAQQTCAPNEPLEARDRPPLALVPESSAEQSRDRGGKHAGGEVKPYNDDELIQCVFTWYHGGHNVYLTGSFNNWSIEHKIRLVRSGHEFTIVKELRRGLHLYKFIVDEQWRYAPDQQTQSDEHGNINNVLDIRDFSHYQFKLPNEYEQACNAVYHQYIPEPSEYSTDAPSIPILLSKSPSVLSESAAIRWNVPLHCMCNHLYHDAQGTSIFGPNISCISTTQRWKANHKYIASGQRYSTCIYVTINPLFPTPMDACDSLFASNPLKSMIVCRIPERSPFPNTAGDGGGNESSKYIPPTSGGQIGSSTANISSANPPNQPQGTDGGIHEDRLNISTFPVAPSPPTSTGGEIDVGRNLMEGEGGKWNTASPGPSEQMEEIHQENIKEGFSKSYIDELLGNRNAGTF